MHILQDGMNPAKGSGEILFKILQKKLKKAKFSAKGALALVVRYKNAGDIAGESEASPGSKLAIFARCKHDKSCAHPLFAPILKCQFR
jgi:hypothetical protein